MTKILIVKTFPLSRYKQIGYIDYRDDNGKYMMDQILVTRQIPVKFMKGEFSSPLNSNLVVVFVKVKKKNLSQFVNALEFLDKRINLLLDENIINSRNESYELISKGLKIYTTDDIKKLYK